MTRNKTLPVLFLVCSKELGSLMSTTYEMEGSHLITSNASIYYAACRKHLWMFSSLVLKIPIIKQAAQLPLEVIKCSRNHIIPKDCIRRVFVFSRRFSPISQNYFIGRSLSIYELCLIMILSRLIYLKSNGHHYGTLMKVCGSLQ